VLALAFGVILGVAGALLIPKLWDGESVPQKLVDALDCPTPIRQTPAAAHHSGEGPDGYSWFAATHADEIFYAGCETGPGTMYLHFPSWIKIGHVVASLHHFGAVCLVGDGVFEGTLLDGRAQLEQLCRQIGGTLENLEGGGHPAGSDRHPSTAGAST
jgi:hypothetical protein